VIESGPTAAPHDQRTALDLYLRRHLPQGRQGRGSCLAPLQHRGDEPASGRDRDGGGAGGLTPCSSSTRPGWHLSDKLIVSPNITLVPLPPKCPELNPVENVWQFIRDNWLSNRVFRSDILEHCCFAWNKLVDQPWTIYVDRIARLGTAVLINGTWYKTHQPNRHDRLFRARRGAGARWPAPAIQR
jgi:hypothetical protein